MSELRAVPKPTRTERPKRPLRARPKSPQAPADPGLRAPAYPKPTPKKKASKPALGRNRNRSARALAEDFGELAAAVRRLPCCVRGCSGGPTDPAHVVAKRRGHAWIVVDGVKVGNIAPLCRGHHTGAPGGPVHPQHQVGIAAFERENRLELRLPATATTSHATLAEVAAAVGRWVLAGAIGEDAPC